MKRLVIIIFLVTTIINSYTQVITTDPAVPIESGACTILFNASEGDQGLKDFTGDIYAHTGVITNLSTDGSDWKHVKAGWDVNIPACKLTSMGNNIFQLNIGPNIRDFYGVPAAEQILQIAFVFRNSDGSETGRDAGGEDIFVEVFEEGLNVSFNNPSEQFSIVNLNQLINVNVIASNNDSIVLYRDGNRINSAIGQELNFSFNATGYTLHNLVARAYDGLTFDSDTVYYLVQQSVTDSTMPSGVVDGINYINDSMVTFVLFAPGKSDIYLFGDFNEWLPDNSWQMYKDGDYFWITVDSLESGKEYIFQYLIDGTIKIADPYCDKISDPWNDKDIPVSVYPDLIKYPDGKTSEIAGVIQTGQQAFNWTDNGFMTPSKDTLVIYETLIRDFTANRDIKTITDTLNYLKKLGINTIELMPFNEFEGNDSWGYNPSFYFAPDKAYGTKNDYKEFINACHNNGIAVIMDIVLNHSYGQSPLVRMYFEAGKPAADNPWYNEESNMQNPDSHWGYDFNHESVYTKKLVDSITSYWLSEYHVDGFRFDFTKGFTNTPYGPDSWASDYDPARVSILERMAHEIWNIKSDAIIIFEHLAVNQEETLLANYGIMLWGNMNSNYNEATMGYHDGGKSNFYWISYKTRGWNDPNLVGYMESHDEERLMYKNEQYGNSSGDYDIKNETTALERMEMASLFFYLIPGPKMMWQFGELGYDISIDQGGRLGKKPILWDYIYHNDRYHLYQTVGKLNELKKTESVFITEDFTINASASVKTIRWIGVDASAVAVGNFDVIDMTYDISFPETGTWYEFFTGDSITVTGATYGTSLYPGEYRLYSTNKFTTSNEYDFNGIIEETKNDAPKVYPNPFNFYLNVSGTQTIDKCSIYDIQGRLIKSLMPRSNTFLIPTEEMKTGFYILACYSNNDLLGVQKIMKQ